jgi:hypothetical protein
MAEYTVFDIKGKGFKYEQYAQEQENAPPPTGTFGCFIGTSNWGPINTPYTIVGGSLEFREIFGYAGTKVDHGWDAANLHFRANSALGIFTRLADTDVAARSNLLLRNKMDKPANIIGKNNEFLGGVLIEANVNDHLRIQLNYKMSPSASPSSVTFYVDFDTEALLSKFASLTTRNIVNGPITVVNGQTKTVITLQTGDPEDAIRIITITAAGNHTIDTATNYQGYITSSSMTVLSNVTVSDGTNLLNETLLNYFNADTTASGTLILTAKDLLYSFKVEDESGAFQKTTYNKNTKTPYYLILNAINDAFNTALSAEEGISLTNYKIADVGANGNLILTGINTGDSSEIELLIEGSYQESVYVEAINTLFGVDFVDTDGSYSTGEDGVNIGTFRAAYRGVEGNTIKLNFSTENGIPTIGVLFRNNLVGTISDYNFDKESENFLGNIIDNDTVVNQIIKYNHGKRYYEFNDSDDLTAPSFDLVQADNPIENISNWTIQDGLYSLSGGTSGEESDDLNYTILGIIEELKNLDLYQIDFIAAPGYAEENIQNALISLCTARQDCFAFIDMPFITGTSNRDAVNKAVRYINGNYIRTEKIDSIYGVLAFPYVVFRKRFYNSQNILASELATVSPTTILPYLYTTKDITTGTSFDIAAGETYGGRILLGTNDFIKTQFILNQGDRDILYADSLDACINPISFNTEAGFFLDGQKTTLRKNTNGKLTSLSRISVMRTGLFIKKTSYRISRQYFFAPIDPSTWRSFSDRLSREIMQVLVSARMIEPNYTVKCDEITNTAQVRNANGMVAYLEFTPYKKLERIKIIANITETDSTVTLA